MDRKGALWSHVNPIILLVIDPCLTPLRPGLLLHPYGWLTRQLQLAAQVPYASFRNLLLIGHWVWESSTMMRRSSLEKSHGTGQVF